MNTLLYLASFAVALLRVCPSVFSDDSPETVTASAILGVPHPPGAPLLVLLGRLALALPVGNPGFRLGVLSALLGAGLVVVLWRLACRLDPPPAGRALAAGAAFLLVLWNPVIVQQAAVPKGATYTGALVLIASSALALASGRVFAASLLAGLLFGLHWMTLGPLFPVLAFGLWSGSPLPRPRAAALCLLAALLGASLYLVMPLRASTHPALNSGAPNTSRLFIAHLTRARYLIETEARKPTVRALGRQAAGISRALHRQLGWGGWALLAAGVVVLRASRRRALAWALATAALPLLVIELYLDLPDRLMFLMGIYTLGSWIALAFVGTAGAALAPARRLLVPAAVLVLAVPLANRTQVRLSTVDRFTWSYDLSRAMLDPLPPGSGLVVYGDLDTFPLLYQQVIVGRRPDVEVLNCVSMRHRWYRDEAVRRGAPPLLMDARDSPDAVRILMQSVRRPWFTSATAIEGVPRGLKVIPYHMTWAYSRLGGPPRYPRAFPMRGLLERMAHRPEAYAEMAVGYTVEALRNTFVSPP